MLTHNCNVNGFTPVISPFEIRRKVPQSDNSSQSVFSSRGKITRILNRTDKRKIMIVGPCSIHDPNAAMKYARMLSELSKAVEEKLLVVMRAYFEKPRTHIGWKGFINDPFLDSTFRINEGLQLGRKILSDITELQLPVANEALDPIVPQYMADFISWVAIGARTTESQLHREMASGLSAPVGFKNNTDGNVMVAINAMKSARNPHHFLGIDENGRSSIVSTKGNMNCHIILRGGSDGPNYDAESVNLVERTLIEHALPSNIIVDCSHDNSRKDYTKQPEVLDACLRQIESGSDSLVGFMLESNLYGGNQPLGQSLKYGVSITDGCLSFEDTKKIILDAASRL